MQNNCQKEHLKLAVKDGRFTAHSGATPATFSSTFVSGIGWRAIAYPDGSIRCNIITARTPKGEKTEEILFKITKSGYVTLNKRHEGKLIPLVRMYKIKEWPVSGIIGLTIGGNNGPYAYFHKSDYEHFLQEYGISEVKNENPNQLYTLYNLYSEEEEYMYTEEIQTDAKGIATKVGVNYGRTREWQVANPNTKSCESYEMWKVTSARWVIITEQTSNRGTRKVMITMEEPQYLSGIPKK